jgi:hypothetical protein
MNHVIRLDLGAKMATSLSPQRAAKFSRDCRPRRPVRDADRERDPRAYAEYGFSIDPAQGDLIYLLCRAPVPGAGRHTRRRVRDLGWQTCNIPHDVISHVM